LLSNIRNMQYGTYGIRFKGQHQQRVAGMYSLGYEKQIDASAYSWDGQTRGEKDIIIFQYTVKGHGAIRIEDYVYQLKKGDAFFVRVPSKHHYYLPSDSREWEFIHLTLFGSEAIQVQEDIANAIGHVFNLELNATPIAIILELLQSAAQNKITDAYEASAFAYSFLMSMHRFSRNLTDNITWPKSISKAVHFIDTHYAQPISLDNIVNVSGLSKYHFTRVFHKTIHLTPIQYLKKVRMNKAIELLKDDTLTIDEIAINVGFSNGNYFSKVFRSSLGLPPGEFRNSKTVSPIDHLIGDH